MTLKRVFDGVAASLGLVLLSPLLIGVVVVITLSDQGSVFFRQERVGRNGKSFHIIKFRTMTPLDQRGPDGREITVAGDSRVTPVGSFLRRYKIDELPQLFNVVKGEMSLVGPRPEVPRYVREYTDEERRVLELKPGITDPASLKYRHEGEILAAKSDPEHYYRNVLVPEKIRINLEYSRHANFLTDMKVIIATIFGGVG